MHKITKRNIRFVEKQLVYLIYGDNASYINEAKYSMASALQKCKNSPPPRVLVFTDKPAEFSNWPVDLIKLDNEELNKWLGSHEYIHRRKTVAILESLQYAKESIFVDTDTFFLKSPLELFKLLNEKEWLVDEYEDLWGNWSDQPIYKATANYLAHKYNINNNMLMINSGVIAFRDNAAYYLKKTLDLIDELHPLAPNVHIVEQFCCSIAACKLSKPAQAKSVVTHYFGEKRYWRLMLNEFFRRNGPHCTEQLLNATEECPIQKVKPSNIKRLFFHIYTKLFIKNNRKPIRLLFFALNLPNNAYSRSFSLGYISHFLDATSLNTDSKLDIEKITSCHPMLFNRRMMSKLWDSLYELKILN